MHSCPEGYTKKENTRKCVPCDGACPQLCHFENFTVEKWLTSLHLRKPEYQNCTIISGNVPLVAAAFLEYVSH